MPLSRPTSTPAAFATNGGVRAEPDAGVKATGITAGQRITRLLMNWLWGVALEWAAYLAQFTDTNDELVYPAAKTRTFLVAARFTGTGEWKNGAIDTTANAGSGFGYQDISEGLRTGQSLVSISFAFTSGGAGTTGLYLKKYVAGVVTTLATVNQAGSGTVTLTPTGSPLLINRATTLYYIEADSADNGDNVGPLTFIVSDVGPRNPS